MQSHVGPTITAMFQQPIQAVQHSSNYDHNTSQSTYMIAAPHQQGYFTQPLAAHNSGIMSFGNSNQGYYWNSSGMDSETAHTTRASPQTVQWLLDNYETAEGVSLPRCTIYSHYLRHCDEQAIDVMNPASFGKLIRSIFLGLRTRRLGTRGNSKYHYYGIRIKPGSDLHHLPIDDDYLPAHFMTGHRKATPSMLMGPTGKLPRYDTSGYSQQHHDRGMYSHGAAITGRHAGETSQQPNIMSRPQQDFLAPDPTAALPKFVPIDLSEIESFPEDLTEDHIKILQQLYREHCESVLDVVANLQFDLVQHLWSAFWRASDAQSGPGSKRKSANSDFAPLEDEDDDDDEDEENEASFNAAYYEAKLSRTRLIGLMQIPQVKLWIRRVDYAFYQCIVQVLIPDLMRPIPSSLTQSIRNFAKCLENWMRNAVSNMPADFAASKISTAVAFAQTLRRYTSLNHLAQAARGVLQNTQQIGQMISDLGRVDFTIVKQQASWVCMSGGSSESNDSVRDNADQLQSNADKDLIGQIVSGFKSTLQQYSTLEQWASWLDGVVDNALKVCGAKNVADQPADEGERMSKLARKILLSWSFYSSLVIRDLTLRSAASFGSFHLLRLLYDEYMFYLLENRVAKASRETPIAIIDQCRPGNNTSNGEFPTIRRSDWIPTYSIDLMPPASAFLPAAASSEPSGTPAVSRPPIVLTPAGKTNGGPGVITLSRQQTTSAGQVITLTPTLAPVTTTTANNGKVVLMATTRPGSGPQNVLRPVTSTTIASAATTTVLKPSEGDNVVASAPPVDQEEIF